MSVGGIGRRKKDSSMSAVEREREREELKIMQYFFGHSLFHNRNQHIGQLLPGTESSTFNIYYEYVLTQSTEVGFGFICSSMVEQEINDTNVFTILSKCGSSAHGCLVF